MIRREGWERLPAAARAVLVRHMERGVEGGAAQADARIGRVERVMRSGSLRNLDISPRQMCRLADAMAPHTFAPGEVVFCQVMLGFWAWGLGFGAYGYPVPTLGTNVWSVWGRETRGRRRRGCTCCRRGRWPWRQKIRGRSPPAR